MPNSLRKLQRHKAKDATTLALICFVAFVLCGCKPKESHLSGQVFLSDGALAAGLPDTEIHIVGRLEVDEFIRKKVKILKAEEMSLLSQIDTAKPRLEVARNNYAAFVKEARYLTNENYVALQKDLDDVEGEIDQIKTNAQSLRTELRVAQEDPYNIPAGNRLKLYAPPPPQTKRVIRGQRSYTVPVPSDNRPWYDTLEKFQKALTEMTLKIREKELRKEELSQGMSKIKEGLITKESEVLSQAEGDLKTLKDRLPKVSSAEAYLHDFVPLAARKALSDSSGHYSIYYPRNGEKVLFAKHAAGENTSFWLLKLPSAPELNNFNLSGRNMADQDPDRLIHP
jgi:hypothetical protein